MYRNKLVFVKHTVVWPLDHPEQVKLAKANGCKITKAELLPSLKGLPMPNGKFRKFKYVLNIRECKYYRPGSCVKSLERLCKVRSTARRLWGLK